MQLSENMDIDTGQFVEINGQAQWLTIRGENRQNPVLLIVSGPGVALSTLALYFAPWEQNFTLVQWDQPGAGATYGKAGNKHLASITIDKLCQDCIAVAQHVCQTLKVSNIALLGISAGSIIGLKAIQQRPELFHTYIGTGQVVHWPRQDQQSYALLLQQFRDGQQPDAVAELENLGPPPY
ncbi:MAG: alpha/beta hydrolase, partial [Pseudomonadota bacterium]